MGKKTVVVWVLSDEDKTQIKQHSEKISKMFKLANYNPLVDRFSEFFDVDDFDFIPCIAEGINETADEDFDDFVDDVSSALGEAFDSVEIHLDDVKNWADEHYEDVSDTIYSRLEQDGREGNVSDWVLENCDENVKQKFLDWVYG